MPFDFYDDLTRAQKATYRRSNAVASIPVPDVESLRPALEAIRRGLEADDRARVSRGVTEFSKRLLAQLGAPMLAVEVLARRPSDETAELHGLYTREDDGRARLQVWMRTAAHQRPVAFRTFVRTIAHELLHHLDFELLRLEDTFHTEGFFRRESSFVRQLLGDAQPRERQAAATRGARQLSLFADDE
jgi:hypothetical protein